MSALRYVSECTFREKGSREVVDETIFLIFAGLSGSVEVMSVIGRLLISLVLSVVAWPAHAVTDSRISWGLSFRSHTFNPEDRTSLDLNRDGRFSFRDRMCMEFDICFREQDLSYGYVFRVVSGDAAVDMISNIRADRVSIVCIDDRHSVVNADFDDEIHLEAGRWYHVRLSVSKTFSSKGDVRGGHKMQY